MISLALEQNKQESSTESAMLHCCVRQPRKDNASTGSREGPEGAMSLQTGHVTTLKRHGRSQSDIVTDRYGRYDRWAPVRGDLCWSQCGLLKVAARHHERSGDSLPAGNGWSFIPDTFIICRKIQKPLVFLNKPSLMFLDFQKAKSSLRSVLRPAGTRPLKTPLNWA